MSHFDFRDLQLLRQTGEKQQQNRTERRAARKKLSAWLSL
jgi:hypothetical protein